MRVSILGKNGPKVVDLNRRKAIREKCLNCSGWITKEVTDCEFADCDLYSFRSGRGKQNAKARDKSIRGYCLQCMCGQRSEVSKCVSNDCPLFPYRNSTTDKSMNIPALPKKRHIGPSSKGKIEVEYLSMGGHGRRNIRLDPFIIGAQQDTGLNGDSIIPQMVCADHAS